MRSTFLNFKKRALFETQKIRDIKPHNFAVGLAPNAHMLYMLDFGIVRKYMADDGRGVR